MKNENQKLSFTEILKVMFKICSSTEDCSTQCPLMKQGLCIIKDIYSMKIHADEIEIICTEWENIPSLADKINEILKPYGMKLFNDSSQIWIDDNNLHKPEEVINKLKTTKWKGKSNE